MKKLRRIIKKIIIESLESASGKSIMPKSGPLLGFEFDEKINDAVVDAALKEYKLWKDNKMYETSKEAFPVLKKYWLAAGLDNANAAYCAKRPGPYTESFTGKKRQGHHWSAAFISYVMKASGEEDFLNINHTPFFWKAYHNRVQFLKDPESFRGKDFYMLFFVDEGVFPVEGNNLFYHRAGNSTRPLNYTKKFFERNYGGNEKGPNEASHSDVFVGAGNAIGGNISQTVSKYPSRYKAIVKKISSFYFDPVKIESQTNAIDFTDFNSSDQPEKDFKS